MINAALQTLVLLASLAIVMRAEPTLNRMSRGTPILVRFAFHLLTLGAVAQILFVLAGEIPSWPMAISTCGIAALLVCDRRLRLFHPPSGGARNDHIGSIRR